MQTGPLVRHRERRPPDRLTLLALCGAALAVLAACRATAPPAPQPAPPALVPEAAVPAPEPVTVSVTARSLNVRSAPGTDAAIVGRARRGDRLEVVGERGEWLEVRGAASLAGWVHGRYVRRDAPCPPDRAGEVLESPPLSFSEISVHGTVVVEADVSAVGEVTGTRVVRNDTGDPALAELAVHEVRQMRFAPPVRRCIALPFVYVYSRTF
jgi:TonB family protein